MARGSQNELNAVNNAAGTAGANANQVFGTDWNAVRQQIMPSAATKESLTQLPMDAANAAFATADQNARNRVAKTNNSAGYTSLADSLAQKKAQADSTAALQGQEAIQNLQNTGIQNANNLFGVNEETMAKLYGTGVDATRSSSNFNAKAGPFSGGGGGSSG